MATPKKTPSGRWRVRVYLGQRDGRPVYVSVTEDTKRGCMDRAAILRAGGLPPEKPKPQKLGDLIDRYIESSEIADHACRIPEDPEDDVCGPHASRCERVD